MAMESADLPILGACVALAAAALLFIFNIQPDASDLAPHRSKLDQLMERRDTIYDNLRDLRFEFRSGKYAESDYEAMKTSLENAARRVALAMVAVSLVAAPRVFAGTVKGTLKNGTTGQPAGNVEVILIQLQGGMQPVLNSKSDAQGHFTFDHPAIG